MPIYAYKCSACGHAKDVLQKISDAPLSVCPECGQSTFSKQVTAAGFQLKGSGWYVTDFRNNGSGNSSSGNSSNPNAAPDVFVRRLTAFDLPGPRLGALDAHLRL